MNRQDLAAHRLSPTAAKDRVAALDAARGFAIFVVLWMNVYGMNGFLIARSKVKAIFPSWLDSLLDFSAALFAHGKGFALLALLFGYGLASTLRTAGGGGWSAYRLCLKRLAFLFAVGMLHVIFLWPADVLHVYAITGVIVLLAWRWPNWLILSFGILMISLSRLAYVFLWEHVLASPGTPIPIISAIETGAVRRTNIYLGTDYIAYIYENIRFIVFDYYATSGAPLMFGPVIGQVLIGMWLSKTGIVDRMATGVKPFNAWHLVVLLSGLAASSIKPISSMLALPIHAKSAVAAIMIVSSLAPTVLALGYLFLLISIFGASPRLGRAPGIMAVGRTALSNYIMQSLFYVVVLYGIGAGLLVYDTPTFALLISAMIFAAQVRLSRWWLRRFQHGPIEWVWRSWVYGQRQPMRSSDQASPL